MKTKIILLLNLLIVSLACFGQKTSSKPYFHFEYQIDLLTDTMYYGILPRAEDLIANNYYSSIEEIKKAGYQFSKDNILLPKDTIHLVSVFINDKQFNLHVIEKLKKHIDTLPYIIYSLEIVNMGIDSVQMPNILPFFSNVQSLSIDNFRSEWKEEYLQPLFNFKDLKELSFSSYQSKVPKEIGQLKNLEYLNLSCSEVPKEIGQLKKLKALTISCPNIPKELEKLKSLESLTLYNVESFAKTNLRLPKLEGLIIYSKELKELPNFNVPQIRHIGFYTPNLKKIPDFKNSNQLETIELEVSKIKSLDVFGALPNLVNFKAKIERGNKVTELPQKLYTAQKLKHLYITGANTLLNIEQLNELNELETLVINTEKGGNNNLILERLAKNTPKWLIINMPIVKSDSEMVYLDTLIKHLKTPQIRPNPCVKIYGVDCNPRTGLCKEYKRFVDDKYHSRIIFHVYEKGTIHLSPKDSNDSTKLKQRQQECLKVYKYPLILLDHLYPDSKKNQRTNYCIQGSIFDYTLNKENWNERIKYFSIVVVREGYYMYEYNEFDKFNCN